MALETERVVELLRLARDHVSLDAPLMRTATPRWAICSPRRTPGPDEVALKVGSAATGGLLSALDARSADIVASVRSVRWQAGQTCRHRGPGGSRRTGPSDQRQAIAMLRSTVEVAA